MKKILFLLGVAALSASAQNYASYNNQPVARESFLRSQWTNGNILQDSSLLVYWTLNHISGTFVDFSGHGITAAYSGGVPGSSFSGKLGGFAPYFNKGIPNSLSVPTTPTIPVPFTVSAWVRANAPTGGYTRILETDYQKGFYLGLDSTMTKYNLIVKNTSATTCVGGTVTTGWPNNAWQMVTGVYDGTNGYLYVNGVMAAGPCAFSTPGTQTLPMKVGYCYVAGYCSSSTGAWDGQVASIRVYGRALAAAEVLTIYNAENH